MSKPRPIFTLQDAVRERLAGEFVAWAELDAAAEERARVAGILRDHPEIGELCKEGRRVFYVFPAGGEYVESFDPAYLAEGRF